MSDIVFPVLLFVLIAATLNGRLFLKKKYSYSEKATLFIPILVGSSILLLTLYDTAISVPSFTVSILLLLVVSLYLSFSILWMRTIKKDEVVNRRRGYHLYFYRRRGKIKCADGGVKSAG